MDGASIREAAIAFVQADGGVRVEDYLACLGALVGEAALAAAGFDVEGHDLAPGSPLLYEPVNQVLSGDQGTVEGAPPGSVVGVLAGWVPALVAADAFPTPDSLYRHVIATLGQAPWGHVVTTTGDEHRPWVMPLAGAYELRGAVVAAAEAQGVPVGERHLLAATALLEAGPQVAGALDPVIAVRLALEVTWGMAKTAPMTPAAYEVAALQAQSLEP